MEKYIDALRGYMRGNYREMCRETGGATKEQANSVSCRLGPVWGIFTRR